MRMMPTYTINSTRAARGFRVTENTGRVFAEMHRPKWYSMDMEGTVDGRTLKLISEGTWRMRYSVLLDGARIGTVNTAAWGQLKWDLHFPDKAPAELEFAMRTWRHRYEVRVTKDLPLLELKHVFRWAFIAMDYTVEVKNPGIAAEQMPLMLALAGFSTRLKMARAHASGG
ncbi:MAG: hypothetical protein ABI432_05785 [Flavobacteriales bacterium]